MQQIVQEIDKGSPYHIYCLLSKQTYAALILDEAQQLAAIAYHEDYFSWQNLIEPILSNYHSQLHLLFNTDFLLMDAADQSTLTHEKLVQMIPQYDRMERVYMDNYGNYNIAYQLLDFNNIATSTPVATSNYKHVASRLAKFHIEDKRDGIFVYWVNKCFYLTVIQDGRLLHLKYYKAETNEDALYYILAAFKLVNQNPIYYPMYVSGFVHEDSQLLEFLHAFIKDIRFENMNPNVDFGKLNFGKHAFPPFYIETEEV